MADIALVIKIPEEVKNRLCFGVTYQKDIQAVCEALNNGTPIPDNATNGDVIKAMFPEIEIIDIRTIIDCPEEGTVYFECFEGDNIHSLDLNWWNAPYQKGGKE